MSPLAIVATLWSVAGENATLCTWPRHCLSHRFSPAADHRVTIPSPPLTIIAPSGAIATLRTGPPHCISRRFSPAADHRVTFLSSPPLAIVAPSGANATAVHHLPRATLISRGCAF